MNMEELITERIKYETEYLHRYRTFEYFFKSIYKEKQAKIGRGKQLRKYNEVRCIKKGCEK